MMFDNLRRLFGKVEVRPIDLIFDIDLNSKGQHIVRIIRLENDQVQSIESTNRLLAYDFKEESSENNLQVIHILKEEDRQTILSLKSLNPEIRPDGSLIFDIEPPVLNYLRMKNVPESSKAQSVIVLDQPIKPTAEVTYNQATGVTVSAGYKLGNEQELVPFGNLKLTKDGRYTRLGNTFVPIEKVNTQVEEILKKGTVTYSIKDIPEFFLRDLVLLKKEFNAVLTDLAGKIQIVTNPFKPVVSVSKDPQGWLDFNIQYDSKGFKLPRNLVLKAKENGDKYV